MGKGYTHFSYCLATALFSVADFSSGASLDGLFGGFRRSGRCLACAHVSGHAAPRMQRPNWLAGHAKPACRSDQRRAITAPGRAFEPDGPPGRYARSKRERGSYSELHAVRVMGVASERQRLQGLYSSSNAPTVASGGPPIENDGVSEATSSDLIVSAKPERREHIPLGILYKPWVGSWFSQNVLSNCS